MEQNVEAGVEQRLTAPPQEREECPLVRQKPVQAAVQRVIDATGIEVDGQQQPGGGRVTLNWRRLLEWTAGMLPAGTPVWLRVDNAYYKGELARPCAERGWDYSISLTNDRWRGPVLEQLEGLPDSAWTDIGMEAAAIFATHRPSVWEREQRYAVVRRRTENGQLLPVPRQTVILVSHNVSGHSRPFWTSAVQ